MSQLKIKIGADPELFVREKKTGNIISAHTLVPGSKIEPYPVPLGAVQRDGTAAEFNITAANSGGEFITNIATVMDSLRKMIGSDYELVPEPTVMFEPTYFKSLPDEVRELGCNPDWNAWTGDLNERPDGDSTTMRTGAGHIHIGWIDGKGVNPNDPAHIEDCRMVVKQLDYHLGMYSLLWDKDTKRRSLYGKAGSCRFKPYGVEYRPMSNVWLRSPTITQWIYNTAIKAVSDLQNQKMKPMEDLFGDYARGVVDKSEEWWNDPKGKKIHAATGLVWPKVDECLNYGKAKVSEEAVKPSVTAKVTRAKKATDTSRFIDKLLAEQSQAMWGHGVDN